MTIARNSVGNILSVVKPINKTAPSFDGQKYNPSAYLFDEEMNEWISFYCITSENFVTNNSGSQCEWLTNNSHVDNEDHFGIKLTRQNLGSANAKIAALAMYQRQKLAAEHNLAPPVHGICCVKVWNKHQGRLLTYWGYLSCRAALGDIVYNPEALDAFEAYVNECRLDNASWVANYTQGMIIANLRNDLGCHPDDISFYDWCQDNDYESLDIGVLKDKLSQLDCEGLQHDYFSFGMKYPCNSFMGDDIHESNVALWKDKPVCIDFGYHCLGGRNRWTSV